MPTLRLPINLRPHMTLAFDLLIPIVERFMPLSQGRQSVSNIVRVQSPSLPLPSSPFPSPPLPLEVGPLIQLGGLRERCKLPQWGLGRSPIC